jgi:multimeric flavodoxin WrbA
MKALLLSGSPRKNGNTELLMRRIAGHFQKSSISSTVLSFADVKVQPCKACGICRKKSDKKCIMTDDDFHRVFELLCDSDIIICGSPVYFGSATPDLMGFLDRAGYVSRSNGNLLARKIGGPVAVARRAGQNFTFAQLLYWYMINDMVVPGSSYWNVAIGREPGEVENDQEGIATIDRFAENCIWLAGKVFG